MERLYNMDLSNKTISFLGDSITEGVGVKNNKNRYDGNVNKSAVEIYPKFLKLL